MGNQGPSQQRQESKEEEKKKNLERKKISFTTFVNQSLTEKLTYLF
jgi:hypothetical protein